jgi:hypothetical protein
MQNFHLQQRTARRLAGLALLSLICVSAQAATPGRGYSSKQPKPTPIRTQEYRAQDTCPAAGCVEFFGNLIKGAGKGG